jgi:tetratricopeptide (TPR) repeat protein
MHNFIRITTLALGIAGTAMSANAATPDEFYTSLLRRGIAAHDAGRYPEASKQLRIAAFGLVEAVDQYQVAQVYLALTYDKLEELDRAREAARRVVIAERVERKYGSLSLPATVRSSFDSIAGRLLAPGDLGTLRGTSVSASTTTSAPAVPPPGASTPARTTTPAAQNTTPPRRSSPPQTTQQPASTPTQQTTTPAKPAQQTATTQPQPKPTPPPASTTAPAPTKPAPTPATTKPQTTSSTPANNTPSTTKPPQTTPAKPPQQTATTTRPAETKPAETKPAPAPTPAATTAKPLSASEIASRFTAAERALGSSNLTDARRLYREVLSATTLDHDALIRVAEGLYRSRDFSGALTAFSRVGTLRRGEEPYRYYIAVALYETGDYVRAKKELEAALPYIEVTPDVARYRTKIEGAM